MTKPADKSKMEMPDSEFVRLAKQGNTLAFENLYRRYNAKIYNFSRQIVGHEEDAEDATQEAFVRAWNALEQLREGDSFNVWLHRIALNVCKDLLKKRAKASTNTIKITPNDENKSEEIHIAGKEPDPSSKLEIEEKRRVVAKAIDALSPEHRLVVTMHHLEGMDIESIAEVLGTRRGTVMSRLARAREVLRRKLAPYVEP
ncbi:MAG: RNA polymerase sigma factor [Armatimonadota bacterium]|nr:RNA polymerase sigma factor [Armatimonadota bacterium]